MRMDDYEDIDAPCVKCGHSPTRGRDCIALGCEEGMTSDYDDDPINASPDDYSACEQCGGTGYEHWCPKCGHDQGKHP